MASRLRKQIVIGFIYIFGFLFISALIWRIFIFSPPPKIVCGDGICSEPRESFATCPQDCPAAIVFQELSVLETRAIQIGEDEEFLYDLSGKISNPNAQGGLARFQYRFIVKDEKGAEIFSKEGSSFIMPGEQKYILIFDQKSPRKIHTVELKILEADSWLTLKKYFEVPLSVRNLSYELSSDKKEIKVTGLVMNGSDFDFREVDVNIIAIDTQNRVVGISHTFAGALLSQEKREFILPNIPLSLDFSGEIQRVIAHPEVNYLSMENYLKKNLEEERALR